MWNAKKFVTLGIFTIVHVTLNYNHHREIIFGVWTSNSLKEMEILRVGKIKMEENFMLKED